ncbi:MAG TPA: DNA replication and repair protein RecF [Pyrinomonadaceae bacterium]|nr:DNA replication and repair protein RecF [Pyrinomonadaceae bacterium]
MQLESIETSNFRNLRGKITCGSGLNVFFGENGHGKTNWLEAIYLLATTRSFKTAQLNECIRFSEELAIVRGRVRQSEEIQRDMQVAIEGRIKSLSINGKRETAQNYLGQLHAVVFNSDELGIVRGLPENRRRFLDAGIVSLSPPFVQTFTDYGRVIRQKNSLLQAAREQEHSVEKTTELLEPWNQQLIALAARIHKGRVRLVERLNEVLERRMFGREELTIRYVSSLEGKGDLSDYEALLGERLELRVQAELAAGHSLVGPHRDDLEVRFDGHEIRKFGSAGQQRSALIALLLAQIAVYEATRGEYPLFLIDDIDAELDHKRIRHLLEFLDGKTQTFVTTSKAGFIEDFGRSATVFGVVEGTAETRAAAAQ